MLLARFMSYIVAFRSNFLFGILLQDVLLEHIKSAIIGAWSESLREFGRG
jgi:hypothetical protein